MKTKTLVTPTSFAEYKPYFLEQRKEFSMLHKNELEKYQNEWIDTAVGKLSRAAINSFTTQITRETCVSRDILLEIMMDVEKRVGSNPLLYADDITTFAKTKTYLTGLFEKVRDKKIIQ